jgi:hypothetical protein
MQICVHEIEYEVYVPVVLSPQHVLQPDNIFMAIQLLKKYDLSESPLGVCRILKSIKILLEGNYVFSFSVNRLPYDSIGSLSYEIWFNTCV